MHQVSATAGRLLFLSYSHDQPKPSWASWYLSTAWLGSTSRQDNFAADATLPSGWYRSGSTSYSGPGFDRRHNCPSADRIGPAADNSASFLVSNMMPPAPNNNQQTWASLENYCRTLTNAGNELYTISGSYCTTVDAIENATGYNLLSAVSSTIQRSIESR